VLVVFDLGEAPTSRGMQFFVEDMQALSKIGLLQFFQSRANDPKPRRWREI